MQWLLLTALLLVCPVPLTDFLVSSGVVPVAYVFYYFGVAYPSLFGLAYWLVVPYTVLFYYVSAWHRGAPGGATACRAKGFGDRGAGARHMDREFIHLHPDRARTAGATHAGRALSAVGCTVTGFELMDMSVAPTPRDSMGEAG